MATEKVKNLSDLPDDILSHLLSFLTTKEAVRTSVLSTRWQYLFVSIRDIELDDEVISLPAMPGFIRSVSNFLYRKKACASKLFKFCFTYTDRRDFIEVSALIRDAFDCDAEELDISCSAHAPCVPEFAFASETFISSSLTYLRLCAVCIDVSKSVSIPNLKNMELNFVEFFGDDASVESFFVDLTSLEYLMMNYCWMKKANGTLNLSLPSLTQLNLYDPHCCRIIFNAPKLDNLTFFLSNGYAVDMVVMKDMPSMGNAELRIIDGAASSTGLGAFFRAMRSVKRLSLHSYIFHGNTIQPPMFLNLTQLDLSLHKWGALMVMLHAAPYLKSLVIQLDYRRSRQFVTVMNVPICLTRCLSTIEVRNFVFEEMVFVMIGYLLQFGEVLDSIKFDFRLEDVPDSTWESLLMLPRSSRRCRVLHR